MHYWSQWSSEELREMQGYFHRHHDEDLQDWREDEAQQEEDCCPRCEGHGCTYCLT